MMKDKIPFNPWSEERIKKGMKICTSRTKVYADPRVYLVLKLPLWVVFEYLWKEEGATSKKELMKIWKQIHPSFNIVNDHDKMVYVHFGDFK